MRSLVLLVLFPFYLVAQSTQGINSFTQQQINHSLHQAWLSSKTSSSSNAGKGNSNLSQSGVYPLLKNYVNGHAVAPIVPSHSRLRGNTDTLFVGATPNDTLVVTGNWQNAGPVYVVSNGVLIFKNANATIIGNIYVLQSGQLIADNSTLYIPQQYFYQRAIFTAGQGSVLLKDGTMNFGGLNHNFILFDSSNITIQHVHFTDWTTTGMYGRPTFTIDTCNTIGEIIIDDSSKLTVKNTDTLLLWHHIQAGAQFAWTFPIGINLANYSLTPASPGINGLKYTIKVDNCKLVWWALMPEDGSDVKVSNSDLRAIGAWFTGNDSTTVSGLVDNSSYINSGNLFKDRVLELDSTSIVTWSLYPMDHAITTIKSCIAGEIGSGGKAQTTCESTFVDGSGGYFWASDTSTQLAEFGAFTSNVRSEAESIVLVGYSSIANGQATAIVNSLLFLIQTTVLQQPVAYDGSDIWVAQLSSPATAFINDSVPIPGSAYILRGPESKWMSFDHYKLYYQYAGNAAWTALTGSMSMAVNQNKLATWNTTGLVPGNYNLMLTLFDNLGDSVSANTSINLLPDLLEDIHSINSANGLVAFPNPTASLLTIETPGVAVKGIAIENVLGEQVTNYHLIESDLSEFHEINIDVSELPAGIYFIRVTGNSIMTTKKFVKE